MNYRAVFKKRHGEIRVYMVGEDIGEMYLGILEPNDYGYEGKYVFNLDTVFIGKRNHWESIHFPVNVLRAIADYGTATETDLLDGAGSKSKVSKPN
jgi:hypothetical protein